MGIEKHVTYKLKEALRKRVQIQDSKRNQSRCMTVYEDSNYKKNTQICGNQDFKSYGMGYPNFFYGIGHAIVLPRHDAWDKGCLKTSQLECWDDDE